ncbi:MAG: hypothetical protein KDE59_05585 [Anaerolineales bacterium]|nr:hypothetical protein [Anaerolineales bacterium]MCB0008315.1 hypothetical protein [Anaerolineales bacterium]
MDRQVLITWGVNLAFAILVAISYVMYGIAFNKIGSFPQERELMVFVRYAFTVLLNPYFIAGLLLALSGSLVRMALFSLIGISRSALAAELSLILMLIFSAIVFRESPRFPRDYVGGFLILIGSYVIAG